MSRTSSVRQVAVLCALPPERNTGMTTVDLAAVSVLRRTFPDAEVILYTWGTMGRYAYRAGELPFDYVDVFRNENAYLNADLRVVWGDFLQSAVHWMPDPDRWDGRGPTPEQVARITFLSDSDDDVLRRTIVFGSTIITNQAKDALGGIYARASRRFFGRVGAVMFRDGFSAAKVTPLRGDEQTLGMDCAFLRDDDDLRQLPGFVPAAQRRGVGIFFCRSPNKPAQLSFARLTARGLGERADWLPWFRSGRKLRLLARLYGFTIRDEEATPGALLAQLSGYRYIVTDTYHLCVNAWRMGIPAICIGAGTGTIDSTLSDKKKEILHEMYDARAFYIFSETIAGLADRRLRARAAASALSNDALVHAVSNTMTLHASAALARLIAALKRAARPETAPDAARAPGAVSRDGASSPRALSGQGWR